MSERAPTAARAMFDVDDWRRNRDGNFIARQDALIKAAAAVEADRRTPARINLARFYLARALYPEAKAHARPCAWPMPKPGAETPVVLILHSVASTLMGRPERGLKDLANPALGNNYDPQLWKALAFARQGRWAEAREKFKNAEFAITALPARSATDRDYGGDARGA